MKRLSLAGQEVAMHVFAVLDDPSAEGAVRAVWSRCRELLGATESIPGTGLPVQPAAVLPDAPPNGSLLLAAQKDVHGHVEAVLRREYEVLNLSVLVSAGAGLPWEEIDRRLDAVLGDPGPLFGVERLYLGKFAGEEMAGFGTAGEHPDGVSATHGLGRAVDELLPSFPRAPHWWHRGVTSHDGVALWDVAPEDDLRTEQRFVVLARPHRDGALNAWTWTAGGWAEMPPFIRYLMHMSKVRYQVRVWSSEPPAQQYRRVQRVFAHSPDASGEYALLHAEAEVATALMWVQTLRQTVVMCGVNAAAAVAGSIPGPGGRDLFARDRALLEWFVKQLDQDVAYLRTIGDGVRTLSEIVPIHPQGPDVPTASVPAVPVPGPVPPVPEPAATSSVPDTCPPVAGGGSGRRVLVLADEWLPARGGLSALNRYLCIALARAGADVYCVVPSSSPEERRDAAAADVRLIDAPAMPGGGELDGLMGRPRLPEGVVPEVIIGHSRITGPHAKSLAVNHYPDAVRFHFVHMSPKDTEWWRSDRQVDAGALSEQRGLIERRLGQGAGRVVAIGPRLYEWLERYLPVDDNASELLRLDPGFDIPGQDPPDPAIPPRVPPGVPQILLLGRLDDEIKGLDIAAKAIGEAIRLNLVPEDRVELLVRGAAEGEAREVREKILQWSGQPALPVDVWNYTTEASLLRHDLLRSSLLLMPSRAEGFGLVGLESIVAGCPALVSDKSGLGKLLRSLLPDELARRVVVPVRMNDAQDVPLWGHMIAMTLANRAAAFATAAEVRRVMAKERTWAMAAETLLEAAEQSAAESASG